MAEIRSCFNLQQEFSGPVISKRATQSNDVALRPIYICGIERSGTNLIYALLASHPNIAMTRRTNMWAYFYDRYGDLGRKNNFEHCLAAMLRYKRLLVLKPEPDRIRREFWRGEPTYGRLFALFHQHYAARLGKHRWGDKSLNTERFVNAIFATYPAAKMIHMIRDPRDRYASARTRWKRMRGKVGVATAMWLSSMELAERNRERYPDSYKIVRYEMLTAHPEEALREVCAFLGEEYAPAMLTMEGAKGFRDAGGNSSYGQRVPGRIATDSVGKYRRVMSNRELAFMQSWTKRYMAACNYPLESVEFSIKDWLEFSFLDCPINVARLLAWRTREAIRDRVGRSLPAYRLVPDAR